MSQTHHRKRRKISDFIQIKSDNTYLPFVEKYSPKTSSDVLISPNKRKEITDWIDKSLIAKSYSKILFLYGSLGIGKVFFIANIFDSPRWLKHTAKRKI